MLTDFDVTCAEAAAIAAFAVGAAVLVFGIDSLFVPSGFRLSPATRQEWFYYWFHTLEFLAACCIIVMLHPATYRIPQPLLGILGYIIVALPILLASSAIIFWRHERLLACIGLGWAALVIISMLCPVGMIGK